MRRAFWLVALCTLAAAADAADRRFVPVPKAPTQRMDVIEGMPIVSASARNFSSGASLQATGSRQARLMVSFKNVGDEPVVLAPEAVVVTTADAVLGLREVPPEGEGASGLAGRSLAPGQLYATQFLLDLPRKARGTLAHLTLRVDVGGERLVFEFQETE